MSQTDNEKRVSNGPHSSPIDRAALKRLCAEANGLVEEAIREIAELPDRTSPASWPEAMLVTSDELSVVLGPLKRLSRAVANVPALLAELEAAEAREAASRERAEKAEAGELVFIKSNGSMTTELLELRDQLAAKDAEIEGLKAAETELAEALGFYADEANWTSEEQVNIHEHFDTAIGEDLGAKARVVMLKRRRARSALSEAPGGETDEADDEEKIGRAVCRQIHLAQWPESNWRPGELDRKVDQYWRHWTPNAILAALSTEALSAPAPPAIKGKE